MSLRYLTAGESHGPALVGILEGLPAGIGVDRAAIEHQLARRRVGHGRSPRMTFEADELEILGGVRYGRTLGSPVAAPFVAPYSSSVAAPVVAPFGSPVPAPSATSRRSGMKNSRTKNGTPARMPIPATSARPPGRRAGRG